MTRDAVRSFALFCVFVSACAADVPALEDEFQSDSDVALQISPLLPRIGNACSPDQANRIRAMVDVTLGYLLDAQDDLSVLKDANGAV